MEAVDAHSNYCAVVDDNLSDDGDEFEETIQEYNEKIFKLIQSFLKKLDSESLSLFGDNSNDFKQDYVM